MFVASLVWFLLLGWLQLLSLPYASVCTTTYNNFWADDVIIPIQTGCLLFLLTAGIWQFAEPRKEPPKV